MDYVEKTPPMTFRLPEIGSPMDDLTPPMGYVVERPSDQLVEKGPPMEFADKPSDEVPEKTSPMNIGERPSDENIREAITAMLELTACTCHDDWTRRGLHERRCASEYRSDVVVLVAAAGWTAPGARVRERYRDA